MPRTYEIADLDGRNRRRVTLAEFRAEIEARRPYTAAIMDMIRRGDRDGAATMQAAMRAAFPQSK